MSGDFNTGATIELILPGNGGGVFVLISLSTTLSSSSLSSTTSMTLVGQFGGVLSVHNVDNTIEDGGWSSYQTISEYPTHFDFQRYTRRLLDYHSPYFQLKFPLDLRRLGDHRIHLDHQENTQNWPNLASQTSQTHQLKQTHQAHQTHQTTRTHKTMKSLDSRPTRPTEPSRPNRPTRKTRPTRPTNQTRPKRLTRPARYHEIILKTSWKHHGKILRRPWDHQENIYVENIKEYLWTSENIWECL